MFFSIFYSSSLLSVFVIFFCQFVPIFFRHINKFKKFDKLQRFQKITNWSSGNLLHKVGGRWEQVKGWAPQGRAGQD